LLCDGFQKYPTRCNAGLAGEAIYPRFNESWQEGFRSTPLMMAGRPPGKVAGWSKSRFFRLRERFAGVVASKLKVLQMA
jgi:hypothetical protein